MRWVFLLLVAHGVFAPFAFAADDSEKVRTGYFGVLAFPRGVRSLAMGMTGTAGFADPANVYYNPAVLALGSGLALSAGANNWQPGIDIRDIGLSATYDASDRTSNWHVGAGLRYVQLDAEPRPSAQPAVYGSYATADASFTDWYLASTVAGGYALGDFDLAAGLAVKYVEAEIADFKSDAWTYDGGVLMRYHCRRPSGMCFVPSLGVSALNFGSQGDELLDPVEQVRYGFGLRVEAAGLQESGQPLGGRATPILAVTLDGELLDFNSDRYPDLGSGVGVELSLVNIMSIRYGYADKQYAFGYGQTFGGGFGYGWRRAYFRFDFALAFETDQSRNISAVGILLDVDI